MSHLLIAASDRIACSGVVLPTKIPGKGKILTALSAYWFREMEDIVGNQLLTTYQESFKTGVDVRVGCR